IFLENGAAAGLLRVRIDAFETVDFANKTNLVINAFDPVDPAGDGADAVTLNFTQVAAGLVTVTVNGGAGNDTFLVQAVPAAAATLTTVTLNGDDGDDTFNVRATPAGATTVVNGGAGNDAVNVSSDAPTNNGNLNAVAGTLTVDVGAGANTMVVSDFGGATPNANVVLTATQITGFAGPADATTINYAATGGTLALTLRGS